MNSLPYQSIIPPPGPYQPTLPPGVSFQQQRGYIVNASLPWSSNVDGEKINEFKRGIFVNGFEKCVTTAMLQKHFSIKPINGIKHPTNKFR